MAGLVAQVDEALAALAKLERSMRRHVLSGWVLFPLGFGANASFAAFHIVHGGDWFGLVNLACAVLLWHSARKSIASEAEFWLSVERDRRALQWYRLLAEAEEYRLANTGGGQVEGENKQPVGAVALQMVCAMHSRPFVSAGSNLFVVSHNVAKRFFAKVNAVPPADRAEFERRMVEFSKAGKAMCCELGDDEMRQVLRETPLSTGKQDEDMRALQALQGGEEKAP